MASIFETTVVAVLHNIIVVITSKAFILLPTNLLPRQSIPQPTNLTPHPRSQRHTHTLMLHITQNRIIKRTLRHARIVKIAETAAHARRAFTAGLLISGTQLLELGSVAWTQRYGTAVWVGVSVVVVIAYVVSVGGRVLC